MPPGHWYKLTWVAWSTSDFNVCQGWEKMNPCMYRSCKSLLLCSVHVCKMNKLYIIFKPNSLKYYVLVVLCAPVLTRQDPFFFFFEHFNEQWYFLTLSWWVNSYWYFKQIRGGGDTHPIIPSKINSERFFFFFFFITIKLFRWIYGYSSHHANKVNKYLHSSSQSP